MAQHQHAGMLDRNPFGQRVAADNHLLAFDDILHCRKHLGLDPDDFDVGLDRLGGNRDSADQPAAADRNDQCVEVGRRRQHFHGDGAGAADDRRVVKRVDEDITFRRL